MRTTIQALIFSVALPTLAVSSVNYDNYHTNHQFYPHKMNVELETSRQQASTPNFIRLVIMRLIYGIASTMGVEDRLEDTFNGAFIPPNADNDFLTGDLGGGDDGDGEGFLGNIFEGDYLF